jgi:hypothetical protein
MSQASQATSPWQKPQLGGMGFGTSAPAQPALLNLTGVAANTMSTPPSYTMPQPPIALPTNAMAVDLRSVPSPAPQPGDPMPRVRIPGYEVPQVADADGFRPRTSMR